MKHFSIKWGKSEIISCVTTHTDTHPHIRTNGGSDWANMNHHIFPISRITSIEYIICTHFLFAIIKLIWSQQLGKSLLYALYRFISRIGAVKKAISFIDSSQELLSLTLLRYFLYELLTCHTIFCYKSINF